MLTFCCIVIFSYHNVNILYIVVFSYPNVYQFGAFLFSHIPHFYHSGLLLYHSPFGIILFYCCIIHLCLSFWFIVVSFTFWCHSGLLLYHSPFGIILVHCCIIHRLVSFWFIVVSFTFWYHSDLFKHCQIFPHMEQDTGKSQGYFISQIKNIYHKNHVYKVRTMCKNKSTKN